MDSWLRKISTSGHCYCGEDTLTPCQQGTLGQLPPGWLLALSIPDTKCKWGLYNNNKKNKFPIGGMFATLAQVCLQSWFHFVRLQQPCSNNTILSKKRQHYNTNTKDIWTLRQDTKSLTDVAPLVFGGQHLFAWIFTWLKKMLAAHDCELLFAKGIAASSPELKSIAAFQIAYFHQDPLRQYISQMAHCCFVLTGSEDIFNSLFFFYPFNGKL